MRTPIAHWTHTVTVVLVLLYIGLAGHLHTTPVTVAPHAPRYFSSVLYEWLILGSVVAGIYNRPAFFVSALFHTISAWRVIGLGILAYVCGSIAIGVVAVSLHSTRLAHMHNTEAVRAMMPHTVPQVFAWLLVSLTAAITEELIFRGYLLQQFSAWTHRPVVAIVLSGLLFGAVHLYQGLAATLPIAAPRHALRRLRAQHAGRPARRHPRPHVAGFPCRPLGFLASALTQSAA